jgi:hypothetical protein
MSKVLPVQAVVLLTVQNHPQRRLSLKQRLTSLRNPGKLFIDSTDLLSKVRKLLKYVTVRL